MFHNNTAQNVRTAVAPRSLGKDTVVTIGVGMVPSKRSITESAIRRRATRKGLKIQKFNKNSRLYPHQIGNVCFETK